MQQQRQAVVDVVETVSVADGDDSPSFFPGELFVPTMLHAKAQQALVHLNIVDELSTVS